MHVMEIRDGFGLDRLVAAERSTPQPGPGEVLLEMHAVSLNYRDLLMVRGEYDPKQPLPLVPCSDGVGTVLEVGEGVSRVARGDRVIPIFAQEWLSGEPTRARLRSTLGGPLDGTLADRMLLAADGVVHAPEHLSDEEAATLPCAALTAWNAVVTHGGTTAGDTVLILGTGGVSIFALQFAKMLGARAIVTSGSDEKLERAVELGAGETIHYGTTRNWGREARRLAGDGVDLVVEVGGAGTLQQSLAACRFGGRIVLVGNLAGGAGELNLIPLFMQQVRVQGVLVGSRENFEAMCRAVAANGLRPVIDRVFPLAEATQAFEHLAAGGHLGKVCVTI
jgi:NADPH:quinone reductase-like Zn-dependent oxidoreductase